MIKSILFLLAVTTTQVVKAHDAIECFLESLLVGGPGGAVNEARSDLDLLLSIDLDHVLTSLKVCTDRQVTFIKGVQASYGKFNTFGEIIDSV